MPMMATTTSSSINVKPALLFKVFILSSWLLYLVGLSSKSVTKPARCRLGSGRWGICVFHMSPPAIVGQSNLRTNSAIGLRQPSELDL
jgi:hypothetical protein